MLVVDDFEWVRRIPQVWCLVHSLLIRQRKFTSTMETPVETNLPTDASAVDPPRDLTSTTSAKQQSMYKTPEDYFFHTKTHIDEGDIVIVFMVSLFYGTRSRQRLV